jgi:ribosomal protein L22
MSAEQETTGPAPQDVPEQAPAEREAAAKPSAKEASEKAAGEKKPAAKKPARKKAAARKAPEAEKQPVAEKQPEAEKQPVAEKQPAETSEEQKPAAEKPTARKKARSAKPAVEEPVASEPATRPRGAAPGPRRKVVRAHARYVRTSARKARMVCGHLRGKSVQEARAILAFTPREVARDWSKLLESAVANAESNHELLEDDLIVREAYADEGPTIKRFRPRAMGRATPIRKRTSHLTITLTPSPEPGTTKRRS